MRLFRPIGSKIVVMTIVAVIATLGVGLVGLTAVRTLRAGLATASASQHALHNQAEVDGANHAARYDVLVLSTSQDADRRAEAVADLAEQRSTLRDGIAETRDLLEPVAGPALRAAFTAIAGPLDAYLAAAAAAGATATAGDPVTAEQIVAVDTAQEVFDERFDALTTQINAHVAAATTAATRISDRAERDVVVLLIAMGILVPAFGLLIRRTVNRTLDQTNKIVSVVDAATAGDLTAQVTVTGTDPIGRMGSGLARLLGDLRGSIGRIGGSANRLGASAVDLLAVSRSMAADAATASERANAAATAARQVSDHIDTVSHGTNAMGAAIQHIAESATTAAGVAATAVRVASETNAIVARLDTSSGKITDVVRVISAIAEQTNLLALNATIEAARAGDAGKGFAIVAGEVKNLAQETATATADITRRIEVIQSDARGAVGAISQIVAIIGQINDIQAGIASEVDEQTANSIAIGHSITEAARSSTEIADGIGTVADTSGRTSDGAASTRHAAQELSGLAAELQQLVASFRY